MGLPRDQYQVRSVWNGCELTIDITANSLESEIEFVQFKIDSSRPLANRGHGSPNSVILAANGGPTNVRPEQWTCYPLVSQFKPGCLGSFATPLNMSNRLGVASLADDQLVFGNQLTSSVFAHENILAWRHCHNHVQCIYDNGQQLHHLLLATHSAVVPVDDAAAFVSQLDASELPADEQGEAAEISDRQSQVESAARPIVASGFQSTTSIDGRNKPQQSLNSVAQALQDKCAARRCLDQMMFAEFTASSLFGTQDRRLMIGCRDGNVEVSTALRNQTDWQTLDVTRLYSLKGRWFVASVGGEVFELAVDLESMPIVAALASSAFGIRTEPRETGTIVLLSQTGSDESVWKSAQPYRLHFRDNGKLWFEASNSDGASDSFECDAGDVGKRSREWTDEFGVVSVNAPVASGTVLLLARREILIQIWESREQSKLHRSTKGMTLGEIYAQYNQMRCCKFVTGIFGNFFLTQQRLELRTTLDDFISQVEASPPGALPRDLELELIERLSVLEIARNQLNRWFDRCTLMYPHQQADITRRWLQEVFGPEYVNAEKCDREAWRIHQQTRAELRQVQASMSRPMAEVGHNLNAISFAFPEEVRCEALAATRRAASLAGKGAVVAAFAGMGGQMLMGIGRASVGDPLGIALLGTVGLSMIGRHLEKTVQDKEKKIRIRAYGCKPCTGGRSF